MPRYFSVRANGNTAHNNPEEPWAYIEGEPPPYPITYFDYVDRCLQNGFARIGWPALGDLLQRNDIPPRIPAYPEGIRDLNRRQLATFKGIAFNDIVILPRKGVDVYYVGKVVKTYYFCAEFPFECAHRIGVVWDRTPNAFTEYSAADFGLNRVGAPFIYALSEICDRRITALIDEARGISD